MATAEEEIEAREKMIEVLIEQARTGEKGIDADIALYLEHTKLGKTIKETSKATKTFTGGIKASAKAMSGSTGSLNDLSAVVNGTITAVSGLLGKIPVLGKAFEFLGDAAAETATFAMGEIQKSVESFTELSRVGQIGAEGISGMVERFDAANLPLATYTKLLTENSTNLALFSTSALEGGKIFSQTMIDMAGATGQPLRRLGFSIEEIGDTVVDFQVMQRRQGILGQLSQAQIKKGTEEYAKELDLIAKLTGKSRKEVEKEREEGMSDARFRASLAELDKDVQKQHRSALSQITDPTLRRAYMDQLSGFTNSTASVTTEIQGMGQALRDAQALINEGRGDSTEAINIMKQQALAVTEVGGVIQMHAKVVESGTSVLGNFATLRDFAIEEQKSQKILAANQTKLMNDAASQTASLVQTITKVQTSVSDMNAMFASSQIATKGLDMFADGMQKTIKFIKEKFATLDKVATSGTMTDQFIETVGDTAPVKFWADTTAAAMFEISGAGTQFRRAQADQDRERVAILKQIRDDKAHIAAGGQITPGGGYIPAPVAVKPKVPLAQIKETAKIERIAEPLAQIKENIKPERIAEQILEKETEEKNQLKRVTDFEDMAVSDGTFSKAERNTNNEMIRHLNAIREELRVLNNTANKQKGIASDHLRASKNGQ